MPKVPYSVNVKARVLPRYTFSSCISAVTRSTKRVATVVVGGQHLEHECR